TPIEPPSTLPLGAICQACLDQRAGSDFLTTLNAGGDTVRGPLYTVISTIYDEVVTPYQSQALVGPSGQVTNVVIQDLCSLDPIEHDQTPNDPVVQQLVSAALNRSTGPLDPGYRPTC
ncbi:MAG: lipase, partial [Nocardioides sp.]